jgi:hypothetical protein
MYQFTEDGKVVLGLDAWQKAGLSYDQFNHDSHRGYLKIHQRGYRGNSTKIDVGSIKRPDRLQAIEATYGPVPKRPSAATGTSPATKPLHEKRLFEFHIDVEARVFYIQYRKPDDTPLEIKRIEEYTNRASILNGCIASLETYKATCKSQGRRVKAGEFYEAALIWFMEVSESYPAGKITTAVSFEKVFKRYIHEGYVSLIHKGIGNDHSRLVSQPMEGLLRALYITHDKPFEKRVWELYNEFVDGDREIWNKETGEIYKPEMFRYKDKPLQISLSTVKRYLKMIKNDIADYAKRKGDFEYVQSKRPKIHRVAGGYSLSRISMDDAQMSRKSTQGDVCKYQASESLSGYVFRPSYIIGAVTTATVYECFRYMFDFLNSHTLPIPGELVHEHHLMDDIPWLKLVFPKVRCAATPTEKDAEWAINALKWGVSKKNGHTIGRFFGRLDSKKSARFKSKGEFKEKKYDPQEIIADDLADIEEHNNSLHPNQKRFPGMTRKDVLLKYVNPDLKPIDKWFLYKFIGFKTETSIRNSDYVRVNYEDYELVNFNDLKKLDNHKKTVTAYWIPEGHEGVKEVYLWQDDKYIGEARRRSDTDFNRFTIEQTEEDKEKELCQLKRRSKFDKFIKDIQAEAPKVGHQRREKIEQILAAANEVKIVETPVADEDDGMDFNLEIGANVDWRKRANEEL